VAIFKYLFGPVPSRRLGISLGVDLIPFKTCTLDCIYCECGCTTDLTLERKIYVPTQEIIAELKQFLAAQPKLDYISFAGSGEPTLASNLGEIIDFLKTNYPQYKVAVLTNGTLLYQPAVCNELGRCDLLKISLDAATGLVFEKINRPYPKFDLEKMLKGIIEFSQEYQSWVKPASLEVLQQVAEYLQPLVSEIIAKREPPQDFFKKISK